MCLHLPYDLFASPALMFEAACLNKTILLKLAFSGCYMAEHGRVSQKVVHSPGQPEGTECVLAVIWAYTQTVRQAGNSSLLQAWPHSCHCRHCKTWRVWMFVDFAETNGCVGTQGIAVANDVAAEA